MSLLNCIREFREAADLPNPTSPISPSSAQKTFILSMLKEEIEEYKEADNLGSNEGRLDALVDIAYFAFGAVAEYGWGEFLNISFPIINPKFSILERLYNKLCDEFTPGLLNHIINYCRVMGDELGDFRGAFVNVHSSNMSKFDDCEKDAKSTQNRYKKIGVETVAYKTKRFWVVKRKKDLKILKSNVWEEPNLKPFLHPTKTPTNEKG